MCYSPTMSSKLSESRLAVLGAGKLGGILLRAYLKQGLFGASRVTATVRHGERAAALAHELGIVVTNDNREAVKGADIVLLTVKPQTVGQVLQEIAPEIGENSLVMSVAASVPIGFVEQQLAAASGGKHDKIAVVRAMPNTPASVDCGMTAICGGAHTQNEHLENFRTKFDAGGPTALVGGKTNGAGAGPSPRGPPVAYNILETPAREGVESG